MRKLNFLLVLIIFFASSCQQEEELRPIEGVLASKASCTPPTYIDIKQGEGACAGDIFTFKAVHNGSDKRGSYQWTVFKGASIISGQGTSTISVQSPASSGFGLKLTHVNKCQNKTVSVTDLAEYSVNCNGGGLGEF